MKRVICGGSFPGPLQSEYDIGFNGCIGVYSLLGDIHSDFGMNSYERKYMSGCELIFARREVRLC